MASLQFECRIYSSDWLQRGRSEPDVKQLVGQLIGNSVGERIGPFAGRRDHLQEGRLLVFQSERWLGRTLGAFVGI